MVVSLIIPVYNVSRYLPRLFETIRSQTHHDIEILLIDDGSSDPTGEICDSFAKEDDRVIVLHTSHRSVSDARNTGIDEATGDYIAFVDGDDYLADDYIEYLLGLCIDNDADMSCCAWTVDDRGRTKECRYRKTDPGIYRGNDNAMRALLTTLLLSSSVWGKLFKRSLFDEVRFPKGSDYYEDDATMYRLVARAGTVAIGGESKYYYQLRSDSMIHRSFNDDNLKIIDVFEERCSFIEKKYPELSVYARSDILMAVNHCVIKMCDERLFDHPCIDGLKRYYREYERDYLKGISFIPAKFFSMVAFINIRLAMRLYCLSGKHTRLN